jgi:hypothetical protein
VSKLTQEQINKIVQLHRMWFCHKPSGVRADFSNADLSGANLSGANLWRADLSSADLSSADLSDADLSDANLSGVKRLPDAPVIAQIDAAILAAIRAEGCLLDMNAWHKCETTHCRAGWAVHLAGDAGHALEQQYGTSVAGALIYAASRPDKPVPNWHVTNEEAMADLIKCAGEQS